MKYLWTAFTVAWALGFIWAIEGRHLYFGHGPNYIAMMLKF